MTDMGGARAEVVEALARAVTSLRLRHPTRVGIDGWSGAGKTTLADELAGVDFDLLDSLDPVLLDWTNRRAAQKTRFGGELFIAESAADPWGTTYLEFFQHNRNTGEPKGILAIDLRGLP